MKRNNVGAALLLVVGVLVMLYPVISTQYNNFHQKLFADQYIHQIGTLNVEAVKRELEEAQKYNAEITGMPVLDPWLLKAAADPGSQAYKDYVSQLDQTDVMARLRVPRVDIDLPVYHGTTDDILQKGVGHLYGTAVPVGGESAHSVLTGHTGLATATLFDHLADMVVGDEFYIDVLGETHAYRVDQVKVINPDEVSDLTRVEGKDYITLLTCYPYAVNSHRLIVRGERIAYDKAADEADDGWKLKLEPWMWLLIAGASVGAGALVVIILPKRRKKKEAEDVAASEAALEADEVICDVDGAACAVEETIFEAVREAAPESTSEVTASEAALEAAEIDGAAHELNEADEAERALDETKQ